MKAFFILFLLLASIPYCMCQITGKSKIVLKDKSILSSVKVWNIYSNKIEYEEKESLHDLATDKIARIENDSAIFSFDSAGQLNARPYDWLIKTNGDTVYCIISQLGGNYIYYYPKGRENRSYIPESSVVKYQVYKPQPISRNEPVNDPLASEKDSSIGKQAAGVNQEEIKTETPLKTDTQAVSPVPKDTTSAPVAATTDLPKKDSISTTENKVEEKNPENYLMTLPPSSDLCLESFRKGELAAMGKAETLWGVVTFCTNGCLCGMTSPILSLHALNREEPPPYIPEGVDSKCYTLGYKKQIKEKRIYNASLGGIMSGIVLLGIAYAVVVTNQY